MKRSGFARRVYEPAPKAPLRPLARPVVYAKPSLVPTPMPKAPALRDERFRVMCRSMPCQHCGGSGDSAGVTWAHSNQAAHGKSMARKASDVFVAALCWACHSRLDQGSDMTQEARVALWTVAHRKTVALALTLGIWPNDIRVPGV